MKNRFFILLLFFGFSSLAVQGQIAPLSVATYRDNPLTINFIFSGLSSTPAITATVKKDARGLALKSELQPVVTVATDSLNPGQYLVKVAYSSTTSMPVTSWLEVKLNSEVFAAGPILVDKTTRSGGNYTTFVNTITLLTANSSATIGGGAGATVDTTVLETKASTNVKLHYKYDASNPGNFISRSGLSAISPLSYSTGSGQFSLQQASTSQPGYLSAGDWNMFNGKQAALGFTPYNSTNPAGYIVKPDLSASSPISYNNSTGQFSMPVASGSQNGYLSASTFNVFNGKQDALGFTPYDNANPNNYISRAGISTTAPLAYNNSTGVASMPAATTAQSGYIASSDFTTFANGVITANTAQASLVVNAVTSATTSQAFSVTNATTAGSVSYNSTSGALVATTNYTSAISGFELNYICIKGGSNYITVGKNAAGKVLTIAIGTANTGLLMTANTDGTLGSFTAVGLPAVAMPVNAYDIKALWVSGSLQMLYRMQPTDAYVTWGIINATALAGQGNTVASQVMGASSLSPVAVLEYQSKATGLTTFVYLPATGQANLNDAFGQAFPLFGSDLFIFGDSMVLTANYPAGTQVLVSMMQRKTKARNVYAYGYGGYAYGSNGTSLITQVAALITALQSSTLISPTLILHGGGNDYISSQEIGDPTQPESTSANPPYSMVWGMNYVLNQVRYNCPWVRTVVNTPSTMSSGGSLGANSRGFRLQDYAGAAKMVAAYYGCQTYDNFVDNGQTANRGETITRKFQSDGVHYDYGGYEDWTTNMARFLAAPTSTGSYDGSTFFYTFQYTATDANYTVLRANSTIQLPVITANRNVTLPNPQVWKGRTVKVWNKNTSGFTWTFTTNVPRDATATNITTLTNSVWYYFESDGFFWNKVN